MLAVIILQSLTFVLAVAIYGRLKRVHGEQKRCQSCAQVLTIRSGDVAESVKRAMRDYEWRVQ